MHNLKNLTITIVGLGMEGGSFAIALREYVNPKKIFAVDINQETLTAATSLGVIDEGYLTPEIPFSQSDLIIMSIYPGSIANYIKTYQNSIKAEAIITDVAGTKTTLMDEVNNFLRADIDFVFGHPMAGNEHQGFLYADKNIFKNANYIIIPTEKNKQKNIELIETLATIIGCKKVIQTTPEIHDQRIAYASQLVHLLSVSMTNSSSFDENLIDFAGGSFRDITRVAKINANLWTDAFFENKEYLLEELEKVKQNITFMETALEKNDKMSMHQFLQKSHDKRSKTKI